MLRLGLVKAMKDDMSAEERTNTTETLHNEDTGIKLVSNNRNGIVDGRQEVFDSTGELIQRYSMVQGILDGELFQFEQGKTRAILRYKMGKQHGESCYFDESGQEIGSQYYREGKLDGASVWKDASGRVFSRNIYKSGRLDGEQKTYHSNGRIRTITGYKKGEIVREEQRFSQYGAPLSEGCFAFCRFWLKAILIWPFKKKGKA